MENKPEQQDGIWDGAGPQSASPSPTVTCPHDSNPQECSFPFCDCSKVEPANEEWPGELRAGAEGVPSAVTNMREAATEQFAGQIATMVDDTIIEVVHRATVTDQARVPDASPKRQPKRDRAKYMRDYRARRSAARTQ